MVFPSTYVPSVVDEVTLFIAGAIPSTTMSFVSANVMPGTVKSVSFPAASCSVALVNVRPVTSRSAAESPD